jgi:hypothetical protein
VIRIFRSGPGDPLSFTWRQLSLPFRSRFAPMQIVRTV